MIQKLSADFAAEIKSKQDAFDVTNAHLRAATRELADQRKQITHWQKRCGDLNQLSQKLRNAKKALEEEERFDWTGRLQPDGKLAGPEAGPAFAYHGPDSVRLSVSKEGNDSEVSPPETDSLASLIRMRRMKLHQERINKILDERLSKLQGASALREFQCKKIVAMCTGIPIDKIEDVSPSTHSSCMSGANDGFLCRCWRAS